MSKGNKSNAHWISNFDVVRFRFKINERTLQRILRQQNIALTQIASMNYCSEDRKNPSFIVAVKST